MVKYKMFKPEGAVSDFVRFFWSLDAEVGANESFVHRALPDNCIELIFYVKGNLSISSSSGPEGKTFTSGIFGQAEKFRQFKTDADFSLFGVYLYPFACKYLFRLPADVLSNEKVDNKTLLGKEGEVLEEQIMLASTTEMRIQLASDFILNRIPLLHRHEAAFVQQVKCIADTNALRSIDSFAHDCNLSRRQFERRFKQLSGFSPKDFFNIVRFRKALHEMERNTGSLAQTAIHAGYYDQSHFTNEFKRLSGYTPKEFVLNRQATPDMRAARDFKN
jgi:AraC-like DNA-binding protein